jgi:hypothetical protein
MGGHLTDPYEQNTQQSPAFGFSRSPHPLQSKKNWQASVGIVSTALWAQCGQVRIDCSCIQRACHDR